MTPTRKFPSHAPADGLGNDVWLHTAHSLQPSVGLGFPYCLHSLPPSGLHPKQPVLENRLSCALPVLPWSLVLPRPQWRCLSQERLGMTHGQYERRVGTSGQI